MNCSIIGSFRKYYHQISLTIELFENNGIHILSPKQSTILNPQDEFVIFESDDENYLPEEIELIALHRILRSDFVYVYNPNGYIGRTTAYEIGRVTEKVIPIFFKEMPKDLPIFLKKNSIITPDLLANFYKIYKNLPDLNDSMSTEFAKILNNNLTLGEYYE